MNGSDPQTPADSTAPAGASPSWNRHLLFAASCFVLSGFAALLYQVIWQRILAIFSGVHIYSITIIVTAFMAGLGLGSLAGGRLADRLGRSRAVFAFGLCELLIGLFALASPWIYYDLAYLRLGFLVRFPAALPLVHLLLLVFPTFMMGASLPFLARGLVRDTRHAARVVGLLYGMNALGSALGAFVTVWFLIGRLGFVGSVRLGSLLNFIVAAGAFLIARSIRCDQEPEEPAAEAAIPAAGVLAGELPSEKNTLKLWIGLYALSGFIALSLELLWFRMLDVVIKSNPHTFGHLLGVYLFFLAAGSIVGAVTIQRVRDPDRFFLWGQWGITVVSALAVILLLHLPADGWFLRSLHPFWSVDGGESVDMTTAWAQFLRGCGMSVPLIRAAQVYVFLPMRPWRRPPS